MLTQRLRLLLQTPCTPLVRMNLRFNAAPTADMSALSYGASVASQVMMGGGCSM